LKPWTIEDMGDRDKLPEKGRDGASVPKAAKTGEVDAFLQKVAAMPKVKAAGPRGRLLFALDATASRQPTWDKACEIQAEMFAAAAALGGLDVQLAYYRGFGEFEASPWLSNAGALTRLMIGVVCLGGRTQIGRVLDHALAETKRRKVNAVIFVGDCVEEPVDGLCDRAGRLGVLGLPLFLFHEGQDALAADAFRQMARLSGGACCPFDAGSAEQLKALLRAVAVYAAGGWQALADHSRGAGEPVRLLTRQLGPKK